MNIALPILLLLLGGLTLWLLSESKIKYYYKAGFISVFCLFTAIFWGTISTFLGWAAHEDDMPEKVMIHWVIIKEPNKLKNYNGKIYILLQSAQEVKVNPVLKFFGYHKDKIEPRLYGLKYSRKLHEQLEKNVMDKLKKGQPVVGKLTKEKDGGKGLKGKSKNQNKKGGGSESQEQDWEFHELRPSDIHEKPHK